MGVSIMLWSRIWDVEVKLHALNLEADRSASHSKWIISRFTDWTEESIAVFALLTVVVVVAVVPYTVDNYCDN
jgi:hypothetical protein